LALIDVSSVNDDVAFRSRAIVADQYFAASRNTLLGPHERLMCAVLEDALFCLQNYAGAHDGKRERPSLEAKRRHDMLEVFQNVPPLADVVGDVDCDSPGDFVCGAARYRDVPTQGIAHIVADMGDPILVCDLEIQTASIHRPFRGPAAVDSDVRNDSNIESACDLRL